MHGTFISQAAADKASHPSSKLGRGGWQQAAARGGSRLADWLTQGAARVQQKALGGPTRWQLTRARTFLQNMRLAASCTRSAACPSAVPGDSHRCSSPPTSSPAAAAACSAACRPTAQRRGGGLAVRACGPVQRGQRSHCAQHSCRCSLAAVRHATSSTHPPT